MFKHKTFLLSMLVMIGIIVLHVVHNKKQTQSVLPDQAAKAYWFLLHRQSNREELYQGIRGDKRNSMLIQTFHVKTGIPGKRPTPLPQLLGREYWIITEKHPEESLETAPYFLTLDIPVSSDVPFGPSPYRECNGQCDWMLPGAFGLHGVGGNQTKLAEADPGSSGCVRHKDEDITYLYNLLDPSKEEIRYYIEDN